MNTGYTNIIEVQTISNEIPFAPIPDVKFAFVGSLTNLFVFFQDPKDVYIDGRLTTKREKTIIVAKKDAPPENHLDGEYIYTHTGYHDVQKWLEFIPSYFSESDANDDKVGQLYVQLFAASTSGNIYPISRVYKLHTYLHIMTIDPDNPDPHTRVKVEASALTNIPSTPTEWESAEPFKSIRPCLFKDGKVQYYLNKEDFTKKEDGSPSNITSGADGDVMIEFPNVNIRMKGTTITISGIPSLFDFSEESLLSPLGGLDSTDNFYVSAYLASESNTELWSLANQKVVEYPLSVARQKVGEKGKGYELLPLWIHTAIQALFILKYKVTDSRSIGYGRSRSFGQSIWTGQTKSNPMDSGTTENTSLDIKLFGLEGLWGMTPFWLDGVTLFGPTVRVKKKRKGDEFNSFSLDLIGYGNYMRQYAGRRSDLEGLGFIPALGPSFGSGSSSTFFCDYFSARGTAEEGNDFFWVGSSFLPGIGAPEGRGLFSGGNVWESTSLAIRFVYY